MGIANPFSSTTITPGNRLPIHLRTELELQRKELKLRNIKQQAEQEKRIKMEAMGIPDDDEIIKKRRERELLLKDKFSIETFE